MTGINRIRYLVIFAVVTSLFGAVSLAGNTNTEAASSTSGKIYVSFFWAGKSDTQCVLRDTLLTDTLTECEKEYSRKEAEIKEMVERRNKRGAGWKWGVFAKCVAFPTNDAYNGEFEKFKKKCKGKGK